MGNYYTTTAPTVTAGYLVKAESTVKIGTDTLFDALDTSNWLYTTYGVPVGLQAGRSLELGMLNSIGFSYTPTWEAIDSANLPQGTVYDMTGEELTVSLEIREFKPEVLRVAINSGVFYTVDNEVLYAMGGGCQLESRPITIEFTNQSCDVPGTANINNGVSGGILTVFDTISSSGLPWDSIVRNELNSLSLEFKARPVNSLDRGKRLASLYMW